MNQKYFLAYIIKPDRKPRKGLQKLFFYTGTEESIKAGNFFWGKGNNTHSRSIMQGYVDRGSAVEVPAKKIVIEARKALWLNTDTGDVFLADAVAPFECKGLKPVLNLFELAPYWK